MSPSLGTAPTAAAPRTEPVKYDLRLTLFAMLCLLNVAAVALRGPGGMYEETAVAGETSKGAATTDGALI